MQQRFSLLQLLLFMFLLGFLLIFIQVGLLTIIFEKLGISIEVAFLILFSSLIGSLINIPLFTIESVVPIQQAAKNISRLLQLDYLARQGKTTIAVNVGGCLIPAGFSLYLLIIEKINPFYALLGTCLVAMASYLTSRPIKGMGIGMPILIAPLSAALAALLIDPVHSAPLAYISGTLGVIIGADLLHLKDIRHLGTPLAAIGGAGTFDGIFITGIVAVLLA